MQDAGALIETGEAEVGAEALARRSRNFTQ